MKQYLHSSSQKILHTYIFVFGINFPKNYISVTRNYFSRINLPRITYHVFVCDSQNYMELAFWEYFLGKSHFSYMKFGVPTPWLSLAKYSAEKTKYIDVSQPPHQGDELKRR